MALIVEDGTGVEGANSYISVDYLDAWAAERNISLAGYTTPMKEAAIVVACSDFLESYYVFLGSKVNPDQGLQLPTDRVGIVPKVKQASAQAAYYQLQGVLMLAPTKQSQNGAIKSETKTLTPMSKSVTYMDGTAQTYKVKTPVIDSLLRGLLASGGSGIPGVVRA